MENLIRAISETKRNPALIAESNQSGGILAKSENGEGIRAETMSAVAAAVVAHNLNPEGSGAALYARKEGTGTAVVGYSREGTGALGESENHVGVFAKSVNNEGLHAETKSPAAAAVAAYNVNGAGPGPAIYAKKEGSLGAAIIAYSRESAGMVGQSKTGTGVWAKSDKGAALQAATKSAVSAAVVAHSMNPYGTGPAVLARQEGQGPAIEAKTRGCGPAVSGVSNEGEGIRGETKSPVSAAITAINHNPESNGAAIYAKKHGSNGFAGCFDGRVFIDGDLYVKEIDVYATFRHLNTVLDSLAGQISALQNAVYELTGKQDIGFSNIMTDIIKTAAGVMPPIIGRMAAAPAGNNLQAGNEKPL